MSLHFALLHLDCLCRAIEKVNFGALAKYCQRHYTTEPGVDCFIQMNNMI